MTSRSILIYSLICFFQYQSSFTLGQTCVKLEDGEYRLSYRTDGPKITKFILVIKGATYFLTENNGEQEQGKIEWFSNCLFKLRSDSAERPFNPDSLNNVQRALVPLGGSCYELNGRRRFRETYCGNLHITKGEGRIVRLGK